MSARSSTSHAIRTLPQTPGEWYRRVWALAWPIMLSNVSVPLVGAVDTAVVGHLPDPTYIGAVALGAIIFSFLYWGFGFLRMGTTGLVAQDVGSGDRNALHATLARALIIATALGVAIVASSGIIGHVAFRALEGSAEVEAVARQYYGIRVFSAPAALVNYAILGFVIGLQNTRAALALQLVLNGTNAALDFLFVMVLGWGVKGVAAATLIGEYTSMLVGLVLVYRILRALGGRWHSYSLWDTGRMRSMLRVNANIFLRTVCLIFAFFYFTSSGAKIGNLILAANAVLMHFQLFMAYSLDGFAHAAEALAGSAYGARDKRAFRSAVRVSTVLAVTVALIYCVAYATLGGFIIDLITGIEEVRRTATDYLPWLVVTPLVSVWSFQLDGIFIGTTKTAEMRNAMIVSLGIYLVAVWVALPPWGNHGLWTALMVFMIARAATLALLYPRIVEDLR